MSNPFLPDLSGNAHRPETNLGKKSFVMIMTFDTSRSIEMSQYCEELFLIYYHHIILIYLSFVAYSFLVPCEHVDFEFRPRGKILNLELGEKLNFFIDVNVMFLEIEML